VQPSVRVYFIWTRERLDILSVDEEVHLFQIKENTRFVICKVKYKRESGQKKICNNGIRINEIRINKIIYSKQSYNLILKNL